MKMSHWIKSRPTVLMVALAVALSVVSVSSTASAATTGTDLPLVLDLSSLSSFADSEGNPVTIIDDATVGPERTIDAIEASGTPVLIKVYLSSTDAPSASDVLALGASPSGEEGPSGVDETPPAPDYSNFTPNIVVATTPTTISVAWRAVADASQYALSVDGAVVYQGTIPSFQLTGLASATSYSLQFDSTHTIVAEGTPTDPPPTEECPTPTVIATEDLSTWDLSQSGPAGHSAIVIGGLRVATDDTTSNAIAAGYFPASVDLTSFSSTSLDWSGTETQPALHLVADFNDDETPDGILVGEDAYGDDYWLTDESAQFVKDAAPQHSPGSGSTNHGTLAEWQTVFPATKITKVGYSIGPEATDVVIGTITSIAVGCTYYTFGLPGVPVDAGTAADSTSLVTVSTLDPISQPQGASQSMGLEAAPVEMGVHSTEFNYRTFIPYATLQDDPVPLDRGLAGACLAFGNEFPGITDPLTFVGDNRSFQQPIAGPKDYRTMMDYRVDWDSGHSSYSAKVGTTKVLDWITDEVIASDSATTDRMKFLDKYQGSNYASVTLSHYAHDPYCPTFYDVGYIAYSVQVQFYRSGLTTVSGARVAFPAHEGWVRWNDQDTWHSVFQLDGVALYCLAGAAHRGTQKCVDKVNGSARYTPDRTIGSQVALYSAEDGVYSVSGTAAMKISDDTSPYPETAILQGRTYFFVTDSTTGSQQLVSTDDGISLRVDATLDSGTEIIAYDGKLYFGATTPDKGYELYTYDGANVSLVTDIYPGSGSSYVGDFVIYDGTLHFSASNGAGTYIYSYNGTFSTQVATVDPTTGPNTISTAHLHVFDGKLMHKGYSAGTGIEMWAYNGTTDALVADLRPGTGNSTMSDITTVGSRLIWRGLDPYNSKYRLYSYDGTSVFQIHDPSVANLYVDLGGEVVYSGGKAFFRGLNGATKGLWYTDGTTATMVAGTENAYVYPQGDFHNQLFAEYGWDLYGTNEPALYDGTSFDRLAWIAPSYGSYASFGSVTNEHLYFDAWSDYDIDNLYFYNGFNVSRVPNIVDPVFITNLG